MAGWPAPLDPVLEGSVVRLEPLARAHEAGLRAAAAHPDIWTWVWPALARGDDAWPAYFEAALQATAAGEEQAFCTIDAATGRPVGSTRFLSLRPADRGLEIGSTWLEPAFWQTGANIEAKLLMLGYCFEVLGCLRVELKTHSANERSRAAMTAMGATFEGVHRKHKVIPGLGVRDTAWFSVVDDEWPQVKAGLRRRLAERRGPRPAPAG